MCAHVPWAVVATAVYWCAWTVPAAFAGDGGVRAAKISTAIVWSAGDTPIAAALSDPRAFGEAVAFDGGVFTQELFAYALKEAFSDSDDEYAGSSRIPSRLSANLPDTRNLFGEHCLYVANRFRLGIADAVGLDFGGSPGGIRRDVPAVLAAALAVQGVWQGLRNEIVDRREGVSLRPKISRRTLALALTFRW